MNSSEAVWLTEAESYLQECREQKRSVRASEFAMRMRRTPVQLAREFHLSVGLRIKDYFAERRLEHARELLRTSGRTTAEIAALAGFGTPRTFYRAFRRSTGVSPTEYRKEMSLAVPDFSP
jgi:AraC-like DNA-binding protein